MVTLLDNQLNQRTERHNYVFRKVPGFQVEVTKNGDIRHFITKKIKKQYNHKDGYKLVILKTDRGKKTLSGVHILVALTFIGPKPNSSYEVNHKDLVKSNNYYKNLEWITHSKNQIHAHKNGRGGGGCGEKNSNVKLNLKNVIKIRKLYNTGEYSQKELGKIFKVSQYAIWLIVTNKTWMDKN